MNSEEIKAIAIAVIELRLSEGISTVDFMSIEKSRTELMHCVCTAVAFNEIWDSNALQVCSTGFFNRHEIHSKGVSECSTK